MNTAAAGSSQSSNAAKKETKTQSVVDSLVSHTIKNLRNVSIGTLVAL